MIVLLEFAARALRVLCRGNVVPGGLPVSGVEVGRSGECDCVGRWLSLLVGGGYIKDTVQWFSGYALACVKMSAFQVSK